MNDDVCFKSFESVDEILRCVHWYEASLVVISLGVICFSAFYKMKFEIFVEFYLCPLLGDKRLIFFPSIVMGGWAYQITKPPVCTNFNPFNHLKIMSGRSTKMPNVIKVVGKLLMGYQLNVVTPFHYILVEQTNSVWDQIRFISSDFKLGASLSQAVECEKWSLASNCWVLCRPVLITQ